MVFVKTGSGEACVRVGGNEITFFVRFVKPYGIMKVENSRFKSIYYSVKCVICSKFLLWVFLSLPPTISGKVTGFSSHILTNLWLIYHILSRASRPRQLAKGR